MNDLIHDLELLFKARGNRPMKVKEMAKGLGIATEEYRSFRRQVRDLHSEGALVRVRKGKYVFKGMARLREGRIKVMRGGSAIFRGIEGDETRIYISRRSRMGSLDGDRVRVLVLSEGKGTELGEGRVVEVLERAHRRMSGRLVRDRGRYLMRPGNPRIDREVVISGDRKGAGEGDVVTVEVEDWGRGGRFLRGTVNSVFHDLPEDEADIVSIILDNGLPLDFPGDVLKEADGIRSRTGGDDLEGRLDCRRLGAFTIDPVDAGDFDDALSIEERGDGLWRVGVHIADVSHYVPLGSAMDLEAMRRGTSVYLVDRAIPMLPERLSGDICSLRPGEDRLTLSVFFDLDAAGLPRGNEIRGTVIRSRRRLTYDEAQAIIDGKGDGGDGGLSRDVRLLYRLSEALRDRRMEKGSLDFDRPEAHVVLDDQGLPLDVRKVIQLGSHRLIEEFMVLANETVAGVLSGARFPLIYRVHERPSSTDLLKLEEALARLGIRAGWRKEGITPRAFQGILEDARGRKEEALVIDLVLRSMKRAIYSVTNVGHFGLASERYTHFTSPIRRYPDLTVHRQVKAWIRSEQPPYLEGEEDRLKEIADLSTERERIADQAEWDSIDLKTVQYMESRIGEAFSGTISRLLAIGFFVLLDSPFIEGMVLLRDLVGDYYDFIEEEYVIRGRRTGRTFKIGDRVKVQVVRTDRRRREIDFRLLGHSRS